MRVFISGGCKNGKSTLAENIAVMQKGSASLYYIATMLPADSEDIERIKVHRQNRSGKGFKTLEIPFAFNTLPESVLKDDSILLESLTSLLGNEMFMRSDFNGSAIKSVKNTLKTLLNSYTNIVVVSDYIYSSAIQYDEKTECYRKGLALLDRFVAECSDIVLEISYGNIVCHKGEKKYSEIHKRLYSRDGDVYHNTNAIPRLG